MTGINADRPFGVRYQKTYQLRRKNSVTYDVKKKKCLSGKVFTNLDFIFKEKKKKNTMVCSLQLKSKKHRPFGVRAVYGVLGLDDEKR